MRRMKKSLIVSFALGMFMVLSTVLAKVMMPSSVSSLKDDINLETLIPTEFEDWKLDLSSVSPIISPEVKGLLEKIYNQSLSRTYVNKKGKRIMLAIAYVGVQKTEMPHRPEICYAANGFDVGKMTKTFIKTAVGQIPVMRLVARQGERNEPITYWIREGDTLTRGWIEQKFTEIGYGLTGKVPDGLLVRVSSISSDEQDSYMIQQAFLAAMLKAVRSNERHWLVGRMSS